MTGDIEKLFQLSLDLICIAGADGYFKKINPAFTTLLGYSEKELLETPFIQFIHPDDREATLQEVESQLKGSPTLYFENRYLHKDGSIRWLAWNAHAADGGLLYAIARDITGQKRKEENLSFEMRELREVVESNTDIFYIYNTDGKLVKWNRAMESLTGLTPQELLHKPALQCIYEEDWPIATRTIQEVFENGYSSVEARFKSAGGTPVPYLFNGYLLKDAGGNVTGFAGTGRDISALKDMEDKIRKSEARYREIFENANDFVFTTGLDGVFTSVNRALCQWSGYRADELIGASIGKVVHPHHLDKARAMTEAKLKGEASQTRYEIEILDKAGKAIMIELNTRLIIENGKPMGVHGIARDTSERRKAEVELSEQLNFIEQLINAIPNPLFYKDTQGRYLGCNKAFEQYIGRPRKEIAGKSVYEISPKELADIYYAADKALFDNPGTQTYEAKVKSSTGELRDVLFNKAVFNKSDGACGGLIGVITDLTAFKRTEAALRESEERFRTLVETADDAIVLMDIDFNIIYENRAAWASLGFSREEWLEQGINRERIHADDLALMMENKVALLNEGAASYKYRVRHKDGRYITRLAKSKVVQTDGKPVAVISILRDITEMERAAESIRQSGLLMTAAERMAHIGGWEYDVNRQSMDWTDEVYRIHGLERGEVPAGSAAHIARSLECYDPADRPVIEAAFRKCAAEGVPYDLEFPFTSAKGRRMWIRTAGYPVFGKGRNVGVAGVVGHIMDITERKEAEEQLKTEKEKAEAATLLKDKFVSLVAHDLRSPMATVNMMVNLTLSNLKAGRYAESTEMLAKIHVMGETMMEMTVNLLDAAKLQSGNIQLARRILGVKTVCDALVGELSHIADKKGVALINNVPDNARWYVDKILFQRVIHNLVTNAVKFSHKSGTVTISALTGNPMQLTVADTGTGIHESILPDLFKYDVKTTTAGTGGERGTGFGLPMSMDIIKAHGGTIRVSSRVGEGSLFSIEMPDVKPAVLVVDDDEGAVALLRIYLESMGAAVLTAANGAEAMEIVQNNNPALVITDIAMPLTDGLALLQNLKNSPKHSQIPVIIITGNRSIGIRQTAFEYHADDFITKPLSEPDFIPRIGRFIAG